jgi:DNA-binding CsgD family transcriptional regulator
VVALEEIVAYPAFTSSEYYMDFLLPMNAHHELEIYLEEDSRLKGFIALLRSRKSRGFSEDEIRMAQAFSPIISLSLENVMLREKVELDKTVMGIMENFPNCGCMLFSKSCKPLFMNRKAKEICADLSNDSRSNQKKIPEVPTEILKNIEIYQKEAVLDKSNVAPVLKEDIIRREEVYRTTYQICSEMSGGTCREKILVLIDHINNKQNHALEKAVSIFGLSRREADVVRSIYEGRKNSEIAKRLCISELTVKTHIQNIFEKMKVNSRTALIYTIISKF